MQHPSEPIPDDILIGIGKVTVTWALVDALIGELFIVLVGANPGPMYVATQSVSSSTLTDWCRTLTTFGFTDQNQALLQRVLSDVDSVRGERNALAHGTWSVDDRGQTFVQTARLDRSHMIINQMVTRPDLDHLAGEIVGLSHQLFEIVDKLKVARKS